MEDKTPYERFLLGSILVRGELSEHDLRTEHFGDRRHKAIWMAMRQLDAIEIPINLITVRDQLKEGSSLDAAGGVEYILDLARAYVEDERPADLRQRLAQTAH